MSLIEDVEVESENICDELNEVSEVDEHENVGNSSNLII